MGGTAGLSFWVGARCIFLPIARRLVGYEAVGLRAKTWVKRQMRVLRAVVWRLAVSGMVVRFVWVPSALQPADPMSQLFSSHNGSTTAAEIEAWCIYERLISVPAACSV